MPSRPARRVAAWLAVTLGACSGSQPAPREPPPTSEAARAPAPTAATTATSAASPATRTATGAAPPVVTSTSASTQPPELSRAKPSAVGVPARRLEGEVRTAYERFLASALERSGVPGAAVAVVQDEAVVFEQGFGVRELGHRDPVTPATLMMIGSATQPMTTLLLATMVDEGKMGWETPATAMMPGFALKEPEATRAITMQHLVCGCVRAPSRYLELVFEHGRRSAEDVLADVATFELPAGLHESAQQSESLFAAGGYVAAYALSGGEDDIGAAFERAMKKRVFDPIGMRATTFSFARVLKTRDRASPHGMRLDGSLRAMPLDVERAFVPVAPAAGAWSNVRDLARLLRTELARGRASGGRRIASAENVTRRWTPRPTSLAGPGLGSGGRGLGWRLGVIKGLRHVEHRGSTFGFSSELMFLPDAGVALVVLANGGAAETFVGAARDRLIELLYGLPEETERRFEETVAIEQRAARREQDLLVPVDALDPALAAKLPGSRRSRELGELRLTFQQDPSGSRLVADAGEWTSEVGIAIVNGTPKLVLLDPPIAGAELGVLDAGGERPRLRLESSQKTYDFE